MTEKIIIFTDDYAPLINGVVTMIKTTEDILKKRGYTVEVIHSGLLNFDFSLYSNSPKMPLIISKLINDKVREADYIHICSERPVGVAARYACRKFKKKYTTSFHTKIAEYLEIWKGIPAEQTWKEISYFHSNAERVMVPTKSLISYVNSKGINNAVVWPGGVDTEVFKPKEKIQKDYISCVYVGRVSVEKNINAFVNINDPRIKKTIIGYGCNDWDQYLSKTDKIFIDLNKEQVAEELPKHDVFVFPSLTDTFGLAIIEALSCGLPVAAFPNDVNNDIIENGVSGILSDSLIDAIIQAKDLNSENCVNRAKKFSWDSATDCFLKNLVRST